MWQISFIFYNRMGLRIRDTSGIQRNLPRSSSPPPNPALAGPSGSGVNFTSVLRAAFTLIGPKSVKWHCWLDCLFLARSGSTCVKAVRRTLMKLSPGCCAAGGSQHHAGFNIRQQSNVASPKRSVLRMLSKFAFGNPSFSKSEWESLTSKYNKLGRMVNFAWSQLPKK